MPVGSAVTSLQSRFQGIVTSDGELREILGEPWEVNLCKELSSLDAHCRAYVSHSPFLLLATAGADGRCDVSPRGDRPGFVMVLDDKTIVIPERPGNRRGDSLRNVLSNPHVGLLFMVPGADETLRLNGRATIIRDETVLARAAVAGRRPALGLAVEVEECFLHCGRAFKRARLWEAESWPARTALPSLAQALMDHARPNDCTLAEMEQDIAAAYDRLY
jgi:PPOX class probable FMN-dependent enzyme